MNTQPITMSPGIDVNTALTQLLEHDPGLVTDAFPLLDDGRCVGIVHVAELMMAISRAQAGLLDTLELLSARIRDEVNKARQIQQELLPPSSFRSAGLALEAMLINSTEISGDFYDYFVIDENRIGMIVGDVSGHGVQSGMVATAAKAGLHLLLDRGVKTPGALLAGMNKAVLATASGALMMTAVVAVVDCAAHTATLANAGHNYPFHYRAASGEATMLDGTGGFPLGFDAESEYPELLVDFRTGDRLLLYTDGIIEARNATGEEFGYDRFNAHLHGTLGGSPESFRHGLVETVQGFSGSEGFEDDVTILVVADEMKGL
jgi:serine phosphatase RsbU (regulator of sigma subunit)